MKLSQRLPMSPEEAKEEPFPAREENTVATVYTYKGKGDL